MKKSILIIILFSVTSFANHNWGPQGPQGNQNRPPATEKPKELDAMEYTKIPGASFWLMDEFVKSDGFVNQTEKTLNSVAQLLASGKGPNVFGGYDPRTEMAKLIPLKNWKEPLLNALLEGIDKEAKDGYVTETNLRILCELIESSRYAHHAYSEDSKSAAERVRFAEGTRIARWAFNSKKLKENLEKIDKKFETYDQKPKAQIGYFLIKIRRNLAGEIDWKTLENPFDSLEAGIGEKFITEVGRRPLPQGRSAHRPND